MAYKHSKGLKPAGIHIRYKYDKNENTYVYFDPYIRREYTCPILSNCYHYKIEEVLSLKKVYEKSLGINCTIVKIPV